MTFGPTRRLAPDVTLVGEPTAITYEMGSIAMSANTARRIVVGVDGSAGRLLSRRTVPPPLEADGVTTRNRIPRGHKVALRAIGAGEAVRKYGQIIGVAQQAIAPGEHIHVHNLAMADFERDCEDVQREAVGRPPAAQILGTKLAGDDLRLTLRCPAQARRGCRGAGRRYRFSPPASRPTATDARRLSRRKPPAARR